MLYQILFSDKHGDRIITEPVSFEFAQMTVDGLNQYKVNPMGDYKIIPAEENANSNFGYRHKTVTKD